MRILLAVLLIAPGAALRAACEHPEGGYASIDAAALALSRCYLARSVREDREFIGAILRTEAGYRVIAEKGAAGRGRASIRIAEPGRLAALWHTHGAPGIGRELFSPKDTAVAERLGVPFYLSDPHGVLRVYEPGGRLAVRLARPSGTMLKPPAGSSYGEVVAHTRHHRRW